MKLLLDECLPRKLKGGLPGHEVKTVPKMGWAGRENGELLPLIRSFALVVLEAYDNTMETLLPLMPQVLAALPSLMPGQIVKIAASPSA